MASHFTSERFAEHVPENVFGACSTLPYKGCSSYGPTIDVADWMGSPNSLFDFEPIDVAELTEDLDHNRAEKVAERNKAAEFYDSANTWPSYADQDPLTRSVELAMAVPGCATVLEQHYVDTQDVNGEACFALQGTGSQALAQNELSVTLREPLPTSGDAAQVTPGTYQVTPMSGFVGEGPEVAQQEAAEAILQPVPMLTEATDESTDEASETPFIEAGENVLPDYQQHAGFDARALFDAYNEARAQRCRRRTLSEAFALLFPAQAAANLILVPKTLTHTELIAALAFSLQIKISNAGRRRRGSLPNRQRLFRKLHDALHKAKWLRSDDANYYYYSRPAVYNVRFGLV